MFRLGNITLKVDSVTQRTLRRANMEMESDVKKRDKMKKVEIPPKVKSSMIWLEWREAFYAYLRTQLGSLDVPLLYVITDPIEFTRMCDNNLSDEDAMIISANLCREEMYHKASYVKDNGKVRQLLKVLLDKSPSSDLCKDNKDDGRAVYTLLAERIGNLADDQEYCTQASNAMDKLYYKDEQSMSFLDFVNRLNSNLHLYHLGGQEFTATSKVSILLYKNKVAEGNPIRATVRNIKCNVRYKSDFNAVVKRIQQDLIGSRPNNNYKKQRIAAVGAVVPGKDTVQRPPGKLPRGLDQNDLTKYVESFHSLP